MESTTQALLCSIWMEVRKFCVNISTKTIATEWIKRKIFTFFFCKSLVVSRKCYTFALAIQRSCLEEMIF